MNFKPIGSVFNFFLLTFIENLVRKTEAFREFNLARTFPCRPTVCQIGNLYCSGIGIVA